MTAGRSQTRAILHGKRVKSRLFTLAGTRATAAPESGGCERQQFEQVAVEVAEVHRRAT